MSERSALLAPLFARVASGSHWKEAVIAWSVTLLDGDVDTPSLRILAGLTAQSDSDEIQEYFGATLSELGQGPIGEVERCLGQARALATAIVAGAVEATDAVGRIHYVAVSPLNHPPSLQPWCDLDGGFTTRAHLAVERLDGDALDAAIVDFATRFLAEDPSEQLRLLQAEVDAWRSPRLGAHPMERHRPRRRE